MDASVNVYAGIGVPLQSVGSNGDFYLRSDEQAVYHKATGSWYVITMDPDALTAMTPLSSELTAISETVARVLEAYGRLRAHS